MIVVVLEVAWNGIREVNGPRWFRINPLNLSGRRLINLIGHRNFVVTNACPGEVVSPDDHGTPSEAWLRENLGMIQEALGIELLLVCGAVATKTFKRDMVPDHINVMHLKHPAARDWTKEQINLTHLLIQARLK